jgi:hypothetical protein
MVGDSTGVTWGLVAGFQPQACAAWESHVVKTLVSSLYRR